MKIGELSERTKIKGLKENNMSKVFRSLDAQVKDMLEKHQETKEEVVIDYSNETGDFLFAVVSTIDEEFWLSSYKTFKAAENYCKKYKLDYVLSKTTEDKVGFIESKLQKPEKKSCMECLRHINNTCGVGDEQDCMEKNNIHFMDKSGKTVKPEKVKVDYDLTINPYKKYLNKRYTYKDNRYRILSFYLDVATQKAYFLYKRLDEYGNQFGRECEDFLSKFKLIE